MRTRTTMVSECHLKSCRALGPCPILERRRIHGVRADLARRARAQRSRVIATRSTVASHASSSNGSSAEDVASNGSSSAHTHCCRNALSRQRHLWTAVQPSHRAGVERTHLHQAEHCIVHFFVSCCVIACLNKLVVRIDHMAACSVTLRKASTMGTWVEWMPLRILSSRIDLAHSGLCRHAVPWSCSV